jgi:hypothetical protein
MIEIPFGTGVIPDRITIIPRGSKPIPNGIVLLKYYRSLIQEYIKPTQW